MGDINEDGQEVSVAKVAMLLHKRNIEFGADQGWNKQVFTQGAIMAAMLAGLAACIDGKEEEVVKYIQEYMHDMCNTFLSQAHKDNKDAVIEILRTAKISVTGRPN
jgi:hypothetical protein